MFFILGVSIHAPVKGATYFNDRNKANRWVSIHAPVKGATMHHHIFDTFLKVSIHAPVKGATLKLCHLSKYPLLFQSTHP